MEFFREKDGTVSFRKILAATAAFNFTWAIISHTFTGAEIPQSYLAVIAGVFVFYFGKNRIRKEAQQSN